MKLLYSNLLSAIAMAASYVVSSTNAQENAQDGSCPAAAENKMCGVNGPAVYFNDIRYVDAATTFQDCYEYAREHGHKSFVMDYGQGDSGVILVATGCKILYTGYEIDADGECRGSRSDLDGWSSTSPAYNGIQQVYNIKNSTLWPDGYSCYENGGLVKTGTTRPTPAPPTTRPTPAPTNHNEYCAAADINYTCDDLKGVVQGVSSATECIQWARENGYKSIQAMIWPEPSPFFLCFQPTEAKGVIDPDGKCSSVWKDSGGSGSSVHTYIIRDFSLWPDGYSCYEGGGLKKYTTAPTPAPTTPAPTPAPTPALTASPTLPAGRSTTTGCPDGEVKCVMWDIEICTPVCCDMQTHQPCFDDNYNISSCAPWVKCNQKPSGGEICFPVSCPTPAMSTNGEEFSKEKHGLDMMMVQKKKAVFLRAMKGSSEN